MFFSYSDFIIFNNIFHLVGYFFWTNFVGLVSKLYILCYFSHNKAVILELFYKIISITYFLSNIYEYNNNEILEMIFWLNVIELYFYLNKTIVVFVYIILAYR